MLLRAYRITDKLGLLLLKTSSAVMDGMKALLRLLTTALRGGVGGIFALFGIVFAVVFGVIRTLFGFVRGVVTTILRGIQRLGLALWRLIRSVLFSSQQGARTAGQRVAVGANGAMARRAARAEIDVKIVEDPLKAQNRRLSVIVLVMGFLVIGAFLWATDPARSNGTSTTIVSDNAASLLSNDATPQTIGTPEGANLALPTPIPIATQVPLALRGGGTLAYTVREKGQSDLWLVSVGSRQPLRITNDVSDERDPAWNAIGNQLAYASNRDGNWEIYIYDLQTQATSRITYDLSFQANPKFSPDGLFIAYESYQGENLDIYAVPLDGSAPAVRITDSEAPDFAPVWSADGRNIAFVSWRDGNQDIYVFNLDTFETTNLTQTPLRNEDNPSWSPDGRFVAFSAVDTGSEKIFVQAVSSTEPQVINFGRTPSWSPDGTSLTFAVDSVDRTVTYLYAVPFGGEGAVATEVVNVPYGTSDPTWSDQTIPPSLVNSGGLPLGVPTDLYVEQFEQRNNGAPFRLSTLLDVQAPRAVLNDLVNDSFNAMRARVVSKTGVDFLATLDDAFWDLERLPNPGEPRRSWHMTGRAVAFQRTSLLGFPPIIEVVKEEVGVDTYWHIYLRVDDAAQSGQLGEPLRVMPWDFLSATQGDVEAYNQGGRLRAAMPSGYYVDLTQLASDYGWERLPAGTDWRANTATRNFWMMVKPEGLDWCGAMLQIYTEGEMVNFCSNSQGS